MASSRPPVTQQIGRDPWQRQQPLTAPLAEAALCPLLDQAGRLLLFGDLFREQKAVLVFVRHFLCYTSKEYVEDLAKVPKSFLIRASHLESMLLYGKKKRTEKEKILPFIHLVV